MIWDVLTGVFLRLAIEDCEAAQQAIAISIVHVLKENDGDVTICS